MFNSEYAPNAEQKKYGPLFSMVQDPTNWKNPIDALIDPEVLMAMGATKTDLVKAITFYTGSIPTITRNGKMLRVTAIGYYMAVGS
jgi:hypothetical protein